MRFSFFSFVLLLAIGVMDAAAPKRVMIVADNIGDYLKKTSSPVKKAQGVNIIIRSGTTERALEMLSHKETDIAAITRDLTEDEKKLYPSFSQEPIASDALVFVVHTSNPIENLSREDIEKIYGQNGLTWESFIGSEHSLSKKIIQPMSRTSENGSFKAFSRYFRFASIEEKKNGLIFNQYPNQKNAKVVSTVMTDDAVVAQLAVRPEAIAYISLTSLKKYVDGKDFKIVSFSKVKPSVQTTFNRQYMLTYRLNFVYSGELDEAGRLYRDWILDAEGQDLFRDVGFAPINLKTKIIQTTSSLTQFRRF